MSHLLCSGSLGLPRLVSPDHSVLFFRYLPGTCHLPSRTTPSTTWWSRSRATCCASFFVLPPASSFFLLLRLLREGNAGSGLSSILYSSFSRDIRCCTTRHLFYPDPFPFLYTFAPFSFLHERMLHTGFTLLTRSTLPLLLSFHFSPEAFCILLFNSSRVAYLLPPFLVSEQM